MSASPSVRRQYVRPRLWVMLEQELWNSSWTPTTTSTLWRWTPACKWSILSRRWSLTQTLSSGSSGSVSPLNICMCYSFSNLLTSIESFNFVCDFSIYLSNSHIHDIKIIYIPKPHGPDIVVAVNMNLLQKKYRWTYSTSLTGCSRRAPSTVTRWNKVVRTQFWGQNICRGSPRWLPPRCWTTHPHVHSTPQPTCPDWNWLDMLLLQGYELRWWDVIFGGTVGHRNLRYSPGGRFSVPPSSKFLI